MTVDLPKVSVVLINWESFEDTSECIESLKREEYDNLEIMVVDNGSTDDSKQKIRENYDGITLVESESNRGFPGGNNLGINEALNNGSEYVFVLNNDTKLHESRDSIRTLVETHTRNPNAGVISPLILNYYDEDKIWFSEGVIKPNRGEFKHRHMGKNAEIIPRDELIENEWVSGCAMMIKSTVFDDVGLMREDYFITNSDVEFSLRVRKAGYSLLTEPKSVIYHKQAASQSSDFQLSYYSSRNKRRLMRESGMLPEIMRYTYYIWFIKAIVHRAMNRSWNSIYDLVRGYKDHNRTNK